MQLLLVTERSHIILAIAVVLTFKQNSYEQDYFRINYLGRLLSIMRKRRLTRLLR